MPQINRKDQSRLDDERKAARDWYQNQYPELKVRIYGTPEGMRIEAWVASLRPEGHSGMTWIHAGTYRASEVTEEKVISWAIGALSTHLQGRAEAIVESLADPSQ